jgi:hypothetical protein
MAEFNIRTDSVDVEQIMRQIRARIKEKRGVDYTEQQIQELASVKLERFLDPKGVRSDLVQQFRRTRGTTPAPPNYNFEDTTLYDSHRGIVRLFRKLLNPFLKLMFNPNAIAHVLHMQGQINTINAQHASVREELDSLYYEVIHNLVLEVTRLGIENKNLKMRVESLNSRMDFDERRARALEGVVQYKAGSGPSREERPAPARYSGDSTRSQAHAQQHRSQPPQQHQMQPSQPQQQAPQAPPYSRPEPRPEAAAELPNIAAPQSAQTPGAGSTEQPAEGGTVRRRRRRRRGRRGGRGRAQGDTASAAGAAPAGGEAVSSTPPHGDPTAHVALDEASSYEGEGADQDMDSGSDSGDDEGPDTAQ